jgi:hypothetical protein
MKCQVRNQYILTYYMEQGPLEADSFAASRFPDIPRNCNCAGLFRVLSGVPHGYLPQLRIHRVYALYTPRIWVIRARDRRHVLLAEKQ